MNYKKLMLPLVMFVLLALTVSAVSAADYTVNSGADTTEIQGVIDSANAGDTVNFQAGEYKDIDNVNITKTLTINGAGNNQTKIYGLGDGNSNTVFNVRAGDDTEPTGSVFQGLSFYMTDNRENPTGANGYGILLSGVENITVKDCSFVNGSASVYIGRSTNTQILNSYFEGVTVQITHGGSKEVGTKALNIMGGTNTIVDNNYFYGPSLDAISVASNAQVITVTNNYIEGASYGMYYGGGVAHVDIVNNTFDGTLADDICLQKSCRDTLIDNNEFVNKPTNKWGSTIIYTEPGNTAHGYPSTMSNITVTNNLFEAGDINPDENPVVAFKIYNQGTGLSTDCDILIENNIYDTVTPFVYLESDWEGEKDGDYSIQPTTGESEITPGEISVEYDGNITATLTDSEGNGIVGQHILVTIISADGKVKSFWTTTDYNGEVQIEADLNPGEYTVTYEFEGNDRYDASEASSTIEVTAPEEPLETVFNINDFSGIALSGANLTGVLTDADGNVLAGQHVVLTLTRISSGASRDYTTTTDYNGEFQFPIFLAVGNYHAKAVFAGNDIYDGSIGEKDFQTRA